MNDRKELAFQDAVLAELRAIRQELAALYAEPPASPLHDVTAKWVLFFADQDRGHAIFENETQARDAFLRAREQWTCSLYRIVGRSGCGPELAMYEPAEPPAPREPLIELAKRWEQHSEGHAKRSYSAAFSPASAAFTEAARVYEQCATELRMLIADAAPSEIARDAVLLTWLLEHLPFDFPQQTREDIAAAIEQEEK